MNEQGATADLNQSLARMGSYFLERHRLPPDTPLTVVLGQAHESSFVFPEGGFVAMDGGTLDLTVYRYRPSTWFRRVRPWTRAWAWLRYGGWQR
jgi:hypothetical protein